jgi:hypothetical protein
MNIAYMEGIIMARERKLRHPVTLFAAIEAEQHDALREISHKERKSMAEIVREALGLYIKAHAGENRRAVKVAV